MFIASSTILPSRITFTGFILLKTKSITRFILKASVPPALRPRMRCIHMSMTAIGAFSSYRAWAKAWILADLV